jgi:hypothetical protein
VWCYRAFYRPSNKQTEETLELPIAFLFSPDLLVEVGQYYPFDTGAVESGKYGNYWKSRLYDFDKFSINGGGIETPCKLVSEVTQPWRTEWVEE